MKDIKATIINEEQLGNLLGIENSKLGYYNEVKQKIQELEAANIDLRIKKNELQTVFDAISDAVIIYDHNGTVQYRNDICGKLFLEKTLPGKNYRALCGKEVNCHAPIKHAINHGESGQFSFTNGSTKQSSKRYYEATVNPIVTQHNDKYKHSRALVLIRDVTDRRLKELQLLQSEKMSSIGLLAAGVAHEINNPMTSIAGYAEALQRRFRDDEALTGDQRLIDFPTYLDVIVREVYRCKAIISSLQSFSRKSDGATKTLDLNEIINEVLELIRHTWQEKNISFITKLSSTIPVIQGDPSALRQIFLNLVLNGIQAIDPKGTITITSHVDSSEVIITVADTGCGIAPEDLADIWTPFFTTKSVGNGQGLGLAVTYDIVEKHNATISVTSVVNKGTEFTLKFLRNRA